jgi:uncharacterized protein YhaN
VSDNLNLDHDEARALHRIVRAMHDGECPKCHRVHAAEDMQAKLTTTEQALAAARGECERLTVEAERLEAQCELFVGMIERMGAEHVKTVATLREQVERLQSVLAEPGQTYCSIRAGLRLIADGTEAFPHMKRVEWAKAHLPRLEAALAASRDAGSEP